MIETIVMIETIIVALITAVIGPIVVNWVKLKMEKKDDKTSVRIVTGKQIGRAHV